MEMGAYWPRLSRCPRPATSIDRFIYVGLSEQVLFVDYDDEEEIDLLRVKDGLGVPTTGRQEVLIRGRWRCIEFIEKEERYQSTFAGIKWDAFRIEGEDRVLVDGKPIEQWERVEGNGARFIVPEYEPGIVEVAVCAGDVCAINKKGLEYIAPTLPGEKPATEMPRTKTLPDRGLPILTPGGVEAGGAQFVYDEGWGSFDKSSVGPGEGLFWLRMRSPALQHKDEPQSCKGTGCNYEIESYTLEIMNSSAPEQSYPLFGQSVGQTCVVSHKETVNYRGARVEVKVTTRLRTPD